MKETLKWQFWCKPFDKNYYRMDGQGWHLFELGLVKVHCLPSEGEMLQRGVNYRGIIIRFTWWFPIDKA